MGFLDNMFSKSTPEEIEKARQDLAELEIKTAPNGEEYATISEALRTTVDISDNKDIGKFIVRKEHGNDILFQIHAIEVMYKIYRDEDGKFVDKEMVDKVTSGTRNYYLTPIKLLMDPDMFCVRELEYDEVSRLERNANRDVRAVKLIDKLIANRLKSK